MLPVGALHRRRTLVAVSDEQPNLRPRGQRRPRMVPFLVTGAVLGAVVGLLLNLLGSDSPIASAGQESIVLAITGALVGGLVGAIAFLVVEWTTLR